MERASLFVLCLFLASVAQVRGGLMFGLCYTPYRTFGTCPTDAEVEADVQVLLRHTSRVRTYSTECVNVNKILLRHASEGSLSLLFGVYIDNRPTDQQEVDFLMEALAEYPYANLAGIVVGNEVMYRNTLPKYSLIQRIHEVRNKVRGLADYTGSESLRNVPVYAVEVSPDPEIVAASDVCGLNIHPFYRPDLVDVDDPEIMSDNILQSAVQQLDIYKNMMSGKPIVVTEIGWPTYSDPTEMHHGDPVTALKFMKKFTEYCEANGIFYYWFEAFDSQWKKPMFPTNQETMSEFNFGLYLSDRVTQKEIPAECTTGCIHEPASDPQVFYTPVEPEIDYQHEEPSDNFPFHEPSTLISDSPFTEGQSVTYVPEDGTVVEHPADTEAYAQSSALAQTTQPYRKLRKLLIDITTV